MEEGSRQALIVQPLPLQTFNMLKEKYGQKTSNI